MKTFRLFTETRDYGHDTAITFAERDGNENIWRSYVQYEHVSPQAASHALRTLADYIDMHYKDRS